jgi:hypothetical protein
MLVNGVLQNNICGCPMKERFLFYILLDEKVKKFCDKEMTVNY